MNELLPREKALKYGISCLTNNELLALVIKSGYEDKSVFELADDLLLLANGFDNILGLSYEELVSIKGIKKAKALEIMAILEISKRLSKVDKISENELKKISSLTTPNTCLAIFKQKKTEEIPANGLILALDDVRDPGNLGAIIRLCDWFGIRHLLCSQNTVDMYNPKVVQSTMGSITRVNIVYGALPAYLKSGLPVFGTFMDGKNIYQQNLPNEGIIVMGNEANGISEEIENLIKERIAIPRFGEIQQTESLNVATATAIILSEFRRNNP